VAQVFTHQTTFSIKAPKGTSNSIRQIRSTKNNCNQDPKEMLV